MQASHLPTELVVRHHKELDKTLLSHPRLALSRSTDHGQMTPTQRTLRYFHPKANGSERSRAEARFMESARQGIEIPSRENFVELRKLYPHRRRDAPHEPSPWIHPVPGDPSRPEWKQHIDTSATMDIRDCRAVCPFRPPKTAILPLTDSPKFLYNYSKGATRDGGDNNVLGHVSVDFFHQRMKRDAEKKQAAQERDEKQAAHRKQVDAWEQWNAEGMANTYSTWLEKPTGKTPVAQQQWENPADFMTSTRRKPVEYSAPVFDDGGAG